MRAHASSGEAQAWSEHTVTALKLMRVLADKKLLPVGQLSALGVVGAASGALASASAGGGSGSGSGGDTGPARMPPARLVSLLQQAVQKQVDNGRYHSKLPPRVSTLLEDYHCFTLPNARCATLVGHSRDAKCVSWVGQHGRCVDPTRLSMAGTASEATGCSESLLRCVSQL